MDAERASAGAPPNVNNNSHRLIQRLSAETMRESLSLLEQDWKIDPLLKRFLLGEVPSGDHVRVAGRVTFHIPYLTEHKKYVLWGCHWPDCHNCCERQGRLPLTGSDLITIKSKMGYSKVSEFVKNETVTATWSEPDNSATITGINLKRRIGETEREDGTHIPCRFLDGEGACTLHPDRPGVCHLYPFTTWLESRMGHAQVHATYQFTGDCPGFYLDGDTAPMAETLDAYSATIYDYNMKYTRTVREGFGAASIG